MYLLAHACRTQYNTQTLTLDLKLRIGITNEIKLRTTLKRQGLVYNKFTVISKIDALRFTSF